MKKFMIAGVGLSVALLTACAGTTTSKPTTSPASTPAAQAPAQTATVRQFDCNTGLSVLVKYLNDEQVAVQVQNYTATLNIAPAASGSRYVATQGLFGFGGEWHEKGNMGLLSAKNVHGTPIQMTCQAA